MRYFHLFLAFANSFFYNFNQILAQKHFHVKFVRISVEAAPFFVEKLQVSRDFTSYHLSVLIALQIRVLPCIVSFIDGVVQDR